MQNIFMLIGLLLLFVAVNWYVDLSGWTWNISGPNVAKFRVFMIALNMAILYFSWHFLAKYIGYDDSGVYIFRPLLVCMTLSTVTTCYSTKLMS